MIKPGQLPLHILKMGDVKLGEIVFFSSPPFLFYRKFWLTQQMQRIGLYNWELTHIKLIICFNFIE